MAAVSKKLIALAAAFGIITEGLKADELQEKLNANEGYKLLLAAEQASTEANEAAEAARAKVVELEGDLSAANKTIADQAQEIEGLQELYSQRGEHLDAANAHIVQQEEVVKTLELELAEAKGEPAEDTRILFPSKDGNTYEVTTEKFRHAGTEYQSVEAIENHKEILEGLVASKAFILKKV